MHELQSTIDDAGAPLPSLEAVLAAWQTATERLERTHEALRSEVSRLTDELEAKNKALARKNRLADLGQMASHVAHEVRNNLVPVTLYLSLLRRRVSDDGPTLDIVRKIERGFTALDCMVNDLLHFTAERDPQRRPVDVRALVDSVLTDLAPQLQAQGVWTSVDAPPTAQVLADADMLRRAVLNLVLNALDAMPDGGEIAITSCHGPRGFELEIADSGPGLSDDARQRAFEPFFTTKSSGTGLGLTIVARIVEAHGGAIWAQNCPEGGAAFTIRLPRQAREMAA